MKKIAKGYCKFCEVPSFDGDHENCSVKNANMQGYLDAFVVTILLLIYIYAVI